MNNDVKYIGLDVHQATICATVLDSTGKLVMESILETKAATILQFIHGLRGSLHVSFEEGTCAAWLHDLLKPHVTQVLVCDPRKNALLKVGNKSDRIDSRKLAELLRSNLLRSVYHEDTGIRTVKEIARSYMTVTRDLTRVMVRLSASPPRLFRRAHRKGDSCKSRSSREGAKRCRSMSPCSVSILRATRAETQASFPYSRRNLPVFHSRVSVFYFAAISFGRRIDTIGSRASMSRRRAAA